MLATLLGESRAVYHPAIVQQDSVEAFHLCIERRGQSTLIGVHSREEQHPDTFARKVFCAIRHGFAHAGVPVFVEQHVWQWRFLALLKGCGQKVGKSGAPRPFD